MMIFQKKQKWHFDLVASILSVYAETVLLSTELYTFIPRFLGQGLCLLSPHPWYLQRYSRGKKDGTKRDFLSKTTLITGGV